MRSSSNFTRNLVVKSKLTKVKIGDGTDVLDVTITHRAMEQLLEAKFSVANAKENKEGLGFYCRNQQFYNFYF